MMKGSIMRSQLLPSRTAPKPGLLGLFRALQARLALKRARNRLAMLDDHLLCDIGLSRSDAQAEAQRPLWDAPSHWQR
jgi:uncharacterized protein YjiS (DUF1127 family)